MSRTPARWREDAAGAILNVGSGQSITVGEVAQRLAAVTGREDVEPEITGKYRVGDIRHCYADIDRARETIGYTPQVTLEEGMRELAEWLEGQAAEDRSDAAGRELAAR